MSDFPEQAFDEIRSWARGQAKMALEGVYSDIRHDLSDLVKEVEVLRSVGISSQDVHGDWTPEAQEAYGDKEDELEERARDMSNEVISDVCDSWLIMYREISCYLAASENDDVWLDVYEERPGDGVRAFFALVQDVSELFDPSEVVS